MDSTNRPKLQHYVTRAYLEGFLAPNETMLHVYSRGKTSTFRAKPQNVAAITNYYSTKREDGTYDDRIEHQFATCVERPGIHIIRRLLRGQHQLSREARAQLAILMAIQEYRVPWMREAMEQFTGAIYERFLREMLNRAGFVEEAIKKLSLVSDGEEAKFAEKLRSAISNGDIQLVPTGAASMHAMGSLLNSLPNIYYSMSWDILEAQGAAFITSDCPVHRYYVPVGLDVAQTGLMDMRVQVRFPLSTERMLILRHDRKRMQMIERLGRKRGNRSAQKMADSASVIRYCKVDAATVESINRHTAKMAARFIFSGKALADGPAMVSGECQNVRHKFTDLPGGLMHFQSIYPANNKQRDADVS